MWQSRDRTHSGLRLGLCLPALTRPCTDPRCRLRTRVLLVDAYNVLNEWPTLAALFEAGQLEAAREGLVAELKGFAHFHGAAAAAAAFIEQNLPLTLCVGWRTVVVFDAKTSTLKEAQREQVTDMLDVVYSCGGKFAAWHGALSTSERLRAQASARQTSSSKRRWATSCGRRSPR